jgi:DNA-directed RNA polymerase subunit H (RpoH/RPB5)
MHILQPKQIRMDEKEVEELLNKLNISRTQLPKIFSNDPSLGDNFQIGDVIKIKRKEDDELNIYYRVVV